MFMCKIRPMIKMCELDVAGKCLVKLLKGIERRMSRGLVGQVPSKAESLIWC